MGERTEPWGTPYLKFRGWEWHLLIFSEKFRLCKKLENHVCVVSIIPIDVSLFNSMSMCSWQVEEYCSRSWQLVEVTYPQLGI